MPKKAGHSPSYYATLNRIFTDPEDIHETVPYVTLKERLRAEVTEQLDSPLTHRLDLFAGPESPLPKCYIENIRRICQPFFLEELKRPPAPGRGLVAGSRRAWFDDRSRNKRNGRNFRRYRNPMSAQDLYENLAQPRFEHDLEPNADRRLILIENIDGKYIYALTENATADQVPPLLSAISAHISFETMICLTISPFHQIYRISFYLTYYIPAVSATKDKKLNLPWLDTSFALLENDISPGEAVSGMYKARTTIEISGRSLCGYTTWAFNDVLGEMDPIDEKEEQEFPYPNEGEIKTGLVHEDLIASAPEQSVDANDPMMDVREYALVVFDVQLAQVVKYWKEVVGVYERQFAAHRNEVFLVSEQDKRLGQRRHHKVKEAYERTRKWTETLSQLDDNLACVTRNLDRFCGKDEGLGWLRTFRAREPYRLHARCAAIHRSRIELNENLKTIRSWLKSCNRQNKQLDLWLKLEGNDRSNDTRQTTNMTVQVITPLMLSIGYCSMNKEIIPFTLSTHSLPFTTLTIFAIYLAFQYAAGKCLGYLERWREKDYSPLWRPKKIAQFLITYLCFWTTMRTSSNDEEDGSTIMPAA